MLLSLALFLIYIPGVLYLILVVLGISLLHSVSIHFISYSIVRVSYPLKYLPQLAYAVSYYSITITQKPEEPFSKINLSEHVEENVIEDRVKKELRILNNL